MSIRFKIGMLVLTLVAASTVFASSSYAQSGETRPGWGHGDDNHIHTGPPGLSVRPGHDFREEQRRFHEELQKEIQAFVARLRIMFSHNFFSQMS